MTKDQFYYLFVNTNCIAELGLRFSVLEIAEVDQENILADLDGAATAPRDVITEADLANSFEDLDFEAVEGLDFFGGDSLKDKVAASKDIESSPFNFDIAGGGNHMNSQGNSAFDNSAFDSHVYMKNAYSYRDQLQNRVNQAYDKADTNQLDSMLAKTPQALSSLCAEMTGEKIEKWLALYRTGEDVIVDLVLVIRQLDQ